MAGNSSFNTQGATPAYGGLFQPKSSPLGSFGSPASSPFSKALGQTSGSTPAMSPKIQMSPYVAPQTPVKKQTVTDTMGNTHTTEYHAPAKDPSTQVKSSTSSVKSPGLISSPAPVQDTPEQVAAKAKAAQDAISARLSQGTPVTFPGLVSGLRDATSRNAQYGDQATQIANKAAADYASVGQQGARAQAGYLSTGTSPVAEGNSAIIANTTANQQKAISEGAQTGLLGTQQALNANNQTQTGLGTAAGLIAPAPTGFNQQVFNPANASLSGGGAINDAVSSYAQKVKNGTMTYNDAVNALSAYGTQGQQALTAALGSGFNINTSNASGSVQADQYGTVQQYTSALQQGQKLQSQLSDLITTFGLNPNDLNAANTGIQAIAKNTSDPKYKILQNYVNDIANTYAQILVPPGGSQTDTSRGLASSMLDATANGQSILDTMKSLDAAAEAKIAGVSTYGGGNQGPSTSTAGTGGNFSDGQTTSAGGYNFVYKNGKWVTQ